MVGRKQQLKEIRALGSEIIATRRTNKFRFHELRWHSQAELMKLLTSFTKSMALWNVNMGVNGKTLKVEYLEMDVRWVKRTKFGTRGPAVNICRVPLVSDSMFYDFQNTTPAPIFIQFCDFWTTFSHQPETPATPLGNMVNTRCREHEQIDTIPRSSHGVPGSANEVFILLNAIHVLSCE